MEKRLLVIQEHNAQRAKLHWDIRFEDFGDINQYLEKRENDTSEPMNTISEKILRSFVIPKHRFPEFKEVLLVIPTEDHPWEYKDFEGIIEAGYGAGEVKLIFNDYVNVSIFSKDKIIFKFKEQWYTIFNTKKNYLIKLNI